MTTPALRLQGLVRLGVATGLWTFGVSLSAPFLDAYLWSLHPSWTLIAEFNLAQFGAMVVTFPVAGWLARRRGAALPLRCAAVVIAVAVGAFLAFGAAAPRHVVGLGILLGVGWGLYWLAQFVLNIDFTQPGPGRDRWQAVAGLMTTAAGLAAPLAAGILVAAAGRVLGFRWLLSGGLTFLAASLLVAAGLPSAPGGAFPFRAAVPNRVADPWGYLLLAHGALGLRDGVYLFAPALLVFALSGSVLDLGVYLAVTQGVSMATYAAHSRWGGPQWRRPSLLLGAGLSAAVGLVLAAGLTVLHVWAFGVLTAALAPLLQVPIEACTLDLIALRAGTDRAARVSHTVVKEVVVNAARVVSVSLMIGVLAVAGTASLRPWLVAVAATPFIAWWAVSRFPAVLPGPA
ncbi:MAG TPA: hypothetical protein VNM16_11060 [Bacillota bacterium]|nr:hypothetical protein [Bacillota bacterium]